MDKEDRSVEGSEAAANVILSEVADELGAELPVDLVVDQGEVGEQLGSHLLCQLRVGELGINRQGPQLVLERWIDRSVVTPAS